MITAADAKLLRDILAAWESLSQYDLPDGQRDGYHYGTDHRHDLWEAGLCLADKLEQEAK